MSAASLQTGGDGALALQKHRGAKPFDFGATWKQRVRGSAAINGGKLTNPKAEWTDIN